MKIILNEIKTKSNLLSMVRILLAIPLWYLIDNFQSDQFRYFAAITCLVASATDILDGYLARKFNEVTELGKIIDPLADKVVIGVVIIKLFLIGEIQMFYFLMIICRDLLIFIGGIVIAKKIGRVLPSNMLGKITVSNIGIVILLIILNVNKDNFFFYALFILSIILMATSLIGYAIRANEFIKRKDYGTI